MKKILLGLILLTILSFSQSMFTKDLEAGLEAYDNKDYKKAVEFYKKEADRGNYMAQFMLGNMYKDGQGVSQSYQKAVELFKKAAVQGDPYAQNSLAVRYNMGQGVKQDKIKAYEWWMKAAKQGNTNAQDNLDFLCKNSPWACK